MLRLAFDVLSPVLVPMSGLATFLLLGDRVLSNAIALHRQGEPGWRAYVAWNVLFNLVCMVIIMAVMALMVDDIMPRARKDAVVL